MIPFNFPASILRTAQQICQLKQQKYNYRVIRMIVRSWHGAVPVEKAREFRDYLFATGVAEAKATPGNLGAYICSRPQDEYEHFFMVSYWTGMEAIKAFAGDEPYIAVTYPEDSEYDLISDPLVLHHEVQNIPSEFPWSLCRA